MANSQDRHACANVEEMFYVEQNAPM